jgi:hypothetical protein
MINLMALIILLSRQDLSVQIYYKSQLLDPLALCISCCYSPSCSTDFFYADGLNIDDNFECIVNSIYLLKEMQLYT